MERQLERLAAVAVSAFSAGAAAIALLDESQGALKYTASAGPQDAPVSGTVIPVSRGLAGHVAVTGETIMVADVNQDPRFAMDVAQQTGYVPKAMATAAIETDDSTVLGVLQVLDPERFHPQLLERLADLAAAIIEGS